MLTALAYLVPIDAWEKYGHNAQRFVDTYREFPPQVEHELVVVCCNGPGTAGYKPVRSMFRGMANRFLNYHGGGWDIGAAQWAAGHLDVDFLVLANSGVFFHRPGWLKRLIEARHAGGEGLYGAMASYEPSPYVPGQVNPHIRTSFYACNPRIFREYPHLIDSREKSLAFEAGEWNFLRWFESRGLPGFMVTWDGCYGKEEFRKPPNIFRKGDQSNLLVWDRYSEMYAHGDPQTRYVQEVFANAGLSLY